MNQLLTALPLLAVLLFSCQKEISFDAPGPGTNNPDPGTATGDLLVKTVAVTGSETMTTLYTYDSQQRLETTTMDGSSAGMLVHNYTKLERDGAGRISRILQKLDQNGMASDTAINLIHYPDGTTMEYDYSVNNISMSGFEVIDSAWYTYTSGKMTGIKHYLSSPLMGTDPVVTSQYDFTYDAAGRVSVLNISAAQSPTGGALSAIARETFTYGNSANYLWTTNNAAQNFLLNGLPNTVNNMVDRLQIDDLTTAANSTTITTTYVLGQNNKPATATVTSTSQLQGTQVTNYTFFYQ